MTQKQLDKSIKILNRLIKEESISKHEYNLIHNLLVNSFRDKHVDTENRSTALDYPNGSRGAHGW